MNHVGFLGKRKVYIVDNPEKYKEESGVYVTAEDFWGELMADDNLQILI